MVAASLRLPARVGELLTRAQCAAGTCHNPNGVARQIAPVRESQASAAEPRQTVLRSPETTCACEPLIAKESPIRPGTGSGAREVKAKASGPIPTATGSPDAPSLAPI